MMVNDQSHDYIFSSRTLLIQYAGQMYRISSIEGRFPVRIAFIRVRRPRGLVPEGFSRVSEL